MQIKTLHPVDPLTLRASGEVLSALAPLRVSEDPQDPSPLAPVAFSSGAGKTVFIVDLATDVSDGGDQVELTARLENGLLLLSGAAALPRKGDSELSIPVALELDPAGFVGLEQESVLWELRLSGAGSRVARQRLVMEMYFVPRDSQVTFPRGLPVEILRDLAALLDRRSGHRVESREGRFGYPGALADVLWTTESVIQGIFDFNPPRYDTVFGAPHFISGSSYDDITLRYDEYRAANHISTSLLNCYDTASVGQVSLEAIGEPIAWDFMEPFGYLRLTPLIGRGLSNNPFYGSDETRQIVDNTNTERTPFGNHAFCQLKARNTIGDPCNGPHVGNEDPMQYVEVATDDETPTPARVERGTVKDITPFQGVTNKISTRLRRGILDSTRADAFREVVGFDRLDEPKQDRPLLSRRWPDPRECPALGDGWEIVYNQLFPGLPQSHRHWRLQRAGESLTLTVHAASDGEANARRQFLILGSLHQSPGPIFDCGPKDLGDVSARYRDGTRYIWAFRTLTFDLRSYDSSVDLEEVARWLQGIAEDGPSGGPRPAIDELIASAPRVRLGQLLEVQVVGAKDAVVEWDGDQPGFRLLERDGPSWTFRATSRIARPLTFVAVDPQTLLASKAELRVEITG